MTSLDSRTVPLEKIRIATPCPARWEEMAGDDRVRFCGTCRKNVYNLSALPRAEAEALVAGHEGRMCALLYRRTDGTVLTADCPVGRRRVRDRFLRRVLMAAATLLGLVGGQLLSERYKTSQIAGEIVEPAPPPEDRVVVEPEHDLTPKEKETLEMLGSLGYVTPPQESAPKP